MPSASLQTWLSVRAAALDEIAGAHSIVGGTARGRRYATQQINQAYAVLLSSQFQGFCRDLHSESVDYLVSAVTPSVLQVMLRAEMRRGRKLDTGNANPGNIGSDFNRLDIAFWGEVKTLDKRNEQRQRRLEELNNWRNAIAHQDFDPGKLGGTTVLHLADARRWRDACEGLARAFDVVMSQHLSVIIGRVPW